MKKLLVAVALAATVVAVVRHDSHQPSSDLVFDRVWIDHMPRGERDMVGVFLAIDEHAIGQFITTSRWTGSFVGFRYEAHEGVVRAMYPQSGKREELVVKAVACDATGFDYCLDIAGSEHGAKRYFSRKDWVIERADDTLARVQALLAP